MGGSWTTIILRIPAPRYPRLNVIFIGQLFYSSFEQVGALEGSEGAEL
jgi:hypothetical protein